ncbi:MAG: hypothetical protein A3F82_01055 [Deltaproteobacteria bacterium RIFCSPLOWO2_12_FULL_44_12]|nr:MAG: hypothetical protein A2712_03900 [Deltaproteobacteria bacterium RIFCSPHIGHO2_01_FULL_43_49]OGQ16330.1 MAG: hypothetical protein A3D22_01870 [Deltaproteobacteria bacterium RIFCSPHIGHO2_02_FULL_44_53]OGQ29290.1 MAG: hypothetical protein A3D98_05655 [Deltaproteobacteria bacterium RIFCSPHIGHO2_12_FULL_44_21]OGQ32847.1 MAG: hypothetical protein A2979_09800 [Deltaproteobacteria bacterium RIFCSPLOWO2_01_FULL_45_74]OGQ41948.1 MAG: hypothetical protein A3I70_09585 [Deltaproteobacteria bacterium 
MIQFEKLIQSLSQFQARYVIIGGLAAVIHGSSYITNDLDICYERTNENFDALVKALGSFKPRLRGPQDKAIPFLFDHQTLKNGMNFTLKTTLGDIDLLGEVSGVGAYQDLVLKAETVQLFGCACLVMSLVDLIRSKKKVNRRKDQLVLPELEAIQKLKKG